jgi:hypothetical protein
VPRKREASLRLLFHQGLHFTGQSESVGNPDAASVSAGQRPRGRRVLISATGFHANVLKIQPRPVFSESDAGCLLEETRAVQATT